MSPSSSRRQVLKGVAASAAAGVGFWASGRGAWAQDAGRSATSVPASEKLSVGFIGTAHRAAANIAEMAKLPNVNVTALCDVDDTFLAEAAKQHSSAKRYNDFRKMIEAERSLDAVLVATPDHVHAIAAVTAMNAGKHVYCEKPLTRTLFECRTVTEMAAKTKRVTQMGTQIHAGANYRRVVELVQAGAIGPVREAHVFVQTQWAATQPVTPDATIPSNLHYDLWVGPTQFRPYSAAYLPEKWRRYWNFGSGTLGDMGCHYIDLVYWSLGLKYPTRAHSTGPGPADPENCPTFCIAEWDFPARGEQPPVKVTWYDGGKLPPQAKEWGLNPTWRNGVVFVGDKGQLFADYNQHKLLPAEKFDGFKPPKPTIPASVGHHKEWVDACLRNDPAAPTCRFEYSGPLAETVLLGTVAYRVGKPLEWDAANLRATNAPEADALIHQPYRDGWSL